MITQRNGPKAQIKAFYNIKLRGLTAWLVMKVCNSASYYFIASNIMTQKRMFVRRLEYLVFRTLDILFLTTIARVLPNQAAPKLDMQVFSPCPQLFMNISLC